MADYTSFTLVPYKFTFTWVLCLPLGMISCMPPFLSAHTPPLSIIWMWSKSKGSVCLSDSSSSSCLFPLYVIVFMSSIHKCKTSNDLQTREAHPSQRLAPASCPAPFWVKTALLIWLAVIENSAVFGSLIARIVFYLTATIQWPQTWIISTYDHHHREKMWEKKILSAAVAIKLDEPDIRSCAWMPW